MSLFRRKQKKVYAPLVNILSKETDFATQEAFKKIRTNLIFSTAGEGCKKVVVTSSVPNEGKTMVSANLAISLAQNGERVLLIDGDLRSPSVHRFFKASQIPGLSDTLVGLKQINDVLMQVGQLTLHIIPAGTIPPNPAELLSSKTMEKVLEQLSSYYDYIIIDSTPVNIVSDALNLADQVNGYIVVARENATEHKELKQTLESLEFAHAKILGIVLNDSKEERRKEYSYGYGYGEHVQADES